MITIKDKMNCCGCGGCAQVCPKQCISMLEDVEGFFYPQVDNEKCLHCSACTKVCPVLNTASERVMEPLVYVANSLDVEIRESSSSGGVFPLLAEWVLNQNGAVFGAAFDEAFSVHHIKILRREDLHRIQGSKYLQSRVENTYAEAQALLEEGRKVLFSGTGCQIAGLKCFLRREYAGLYTVEVLCHGVPTPKLWKRYLNEQEARFGGKAMAVNFRCKIPGWKKYSIEQKFQNGEIYRKTLSEDKFMRCFLQNICLRPSCHNCRFREGKSGADLILGDAWGIEKWMPELDDDKGTSVVLVNSRKGYDLWLQTADKFQAKLGNIAEIVIGNPVYIHSVSPHRNRTQFFSALSEGASVDQLEKISRKTVWERGILRGKRIMVSAWKKIRSYIDRK